MGMVKFDHEGIKKAFREETSPCAIGGYDIVGGGEERWLKYFWGLLYPEAFVWNPGVNKDVIPFFYRLKEEEAFGERERQIVYGMLTSVSGLSFLFDREKERFRNLFTEKPDWPDEVKKSVEIQLGSFSFCESPSCGRLFVEKRKGNRFCSDACRKKAHAVPSSERKDPTTVRAYFYRKINEDFSREDAWEQTRKRHGETLKKLGLDGPKPPKTWAQNKEG